MINFSQYTTLYQFKIQGDIGVWGPSNNFEGPWVGILIGRGEFTDSHHNSVYMSY